VSAASWIRDPTGRHEYRYWDGSNWTDHVADQGVEARDDPTADLRPPVPPAADAGSPLVGYWISAVAVFFLGLLVIGAGFEQGRGNAAALFLWGALVALIPFPLGLRTRLWATRLRALQATDDAVVEAMRVLVRPAGRRSRLAKSYGWTVALEPLQPDSAIGAVDRIRPMAFQVLRSLEGNPFTATDYAGPEAGMLMIATAQRWIWPAPPRLWPLRRVPRAVHR
jgi:Protein of unknown function (DUF2510)